MSAIILLAVGVGLSSLAYPSATITNFRTDVAIRTDVVITGSTSTSTYAYTITNSIIFPYTTAWYSTNNVIEGCYGFPSCVQSSWGYTTLFTTSFSTLTTHPVLVSKSTQMLYQTETLYQTISLQRNVPLYTSLGLSPAEFVIVAILVIVVGGFAILYVRKGTIKPQQAKLSKFISPTGRTPNNAFCVNCGAKLPKNSTFCNKCGEKQP